MNVDGAGWVGVTEPRGSDDFGTPGGEGKPQIDTKPVEKWRN